MTIITSIPKKIATDTAGVAKMGMELTTNPPSSGFDWLQKLPQILEAIQNVKEIVSLARSGSTSEPQTQQIERSEPMPQWQQQQPQQAQQAQKPCKCDALLGMLNMFLESKVKTDGDKELFSLLQNSHITVNDAYQTVKMFSGAK
jgi:hypothetical protein